jgi:hypothetical protein
MKPQSRLIAALAFALLLEARGALAEPMKSKLGFYVEMPAGFGLVQGDGSSRFTFSDPNGVMEYDLIAYDKGRFSGISALAAESLKKLGSEGETSAFSYEGRKAALASLDFVLGEAEELGFAVFIEGIGKEPDFALLAFAPADMFEGYADFILSCIDAFSIDEAARRAPGPISQFTLPWPCEHKESRKVALPGGASALLPWSAEEARQEGDTCMREYKVLAAYADEEELWTDAWARFYRMAYRESAARLDRLALEAARLLPPDDPTEQARRVLSWVQGWTYERERDGTDFIPPMTAAYEGRGDCDSRAMAAAILLERLGIDAIMMVSREYSHALLGVDVPGQGQRFPFAGKEYLIGETTYSEAGLGMIAKDQSDFSKWMGIRLGR